MATEITCIVADEDGIQFLGGANWTKDHATVVAEIEEGREFFIEKHLARIRLVVTPVRGRMHLRTDPEDAAGDDLRELPTCSPLSLTHQSN